MPFIRPEVIARSLFWFESSGVDVLEHERGVGAAEAEGIRQHRAAASTLSRRSRTIGMSAKAGSISSICALSQMKPFCIISSE